jgi:hypothetical protein
MHKRTAVAVALVCGSLLLFLFGNKLAPVQGQPQSSDAAARLPEKGGQEQSGQYEVVRDWPKPLTALPGHEKWTWGSPEGIFAENPNRIYVVERGELPFLTRMKNTPIPRNASQGPVAAAPGEGGTGETPGGPGFLGKDGIDYRWEHVFLILDREGNIVENLSQWDKMFKRPHAVYINPYDPEKHVWVVEDARCQIYEFTNDGKKIVMTLGTANEPGADAKHFNRPTFLAWLPDGTMFVADGYNGTRVAKFDKNGEFLLDWGKKGDLGKETRPGYFNSVHGIAVDPVTRRVFVNDRENHRIQVFDENGKYLDEWRTGDPPSHVYSIYIGADHKYLWAADSGTWKMIKWDLNGKFQYSFGYQGDAPGAFWGVHQFSVDQEGNLYVAEVSAGRVQKFRPMQGADPTKLISKPEYVAWKD